MAKVWIALMSKMIYNLIDLASWVGLNSPFFVKDWESCFLPRMNSYKQLEALSPPFFVYMETAKMKYLDSVVFFRWISFIYSYLFTLWLCVFSFPIATLSIFSGFNSFKGCLSYSFLVPKICIRKVPSLLNVAQVWLFLMRRMSGVPIRISCLACCSDEELLLKELKIMENELQEMAFLKCMMSLLHFNCCVLFLLPALWLEIVQDLRQPKKHLLKKQPCLQRVP